MVFPIRCSGCGKVIGSYYDYYCREVNKRKLNKSMDIKKVIYLTKDFKEKTIEGEVLDELKIIKACCRTVFLTHVDIIK